MAHTRAVTHPSTNPARCRVTSLMCVTPLPLSHKVVNYKCEQTFGVFKYKKTDVFIFNNKFLLPPATRGHGEYFKSIHNAGIQTRSLLRVFGLIDCVEA